MQKIGILSDSHGRGPITRKAVKLLLRHGADCLIHLGDICSESVIDALIEKSDKNGNPAPPVHIVFGNCDWDIAGLSRYAEHLGINATHPVGRLDVNGRRIVFTHGDRTEPMRAAVRDRTDFLLHGHTHRVRDEMVEETRVINPGALYRASKYTVALLEPASNRIDFLDVI